jgi:hypothetical protein
LALARADLSETHIVSCVPKHELLHDILEATLSSAVLVICPHLV